VSRFHEPSDPTGTGHSPFPDRSAAGELRRGWLRTIALLVPVLVAIWVVPGFTTQDGPAHAYNAWILADSFSSRSAYAPFYEVRWQPMPNWAGHLALAGLFQLVSPRAADRILMSVTLAGFAASLVWLRWRVTEGEVSWIACLLAAFLSLNYLWLMGFTGFLLGSCLFPITLGVWWSGRERMGPLRLAALSALLVLGYFCHLVSLGLTVLCLVALALAAPFSEGLPAGWRVRLHRLTRTAVCLIPLVPLGLVYLRLSRRGGPMRPMWENLASAYSPAAWVARLGWVDPLTVAVKDMLPFTEQTQRAFSAFSPAVWFALAVVFWWAGRLEEGTDRDRAGRARGVWLILAVLLVVAGILGPDSLGPGHGEYLPQRLVLFGLAALVPVFDVTPGRLFGRLTTLCLLAAVLLQTIIIWDYAIYANRTAGQLMAATDLAGRDRRIATVLNHIGSRFRVNPVLHADCWLGVGTGNIVWSNYETRHYYFPIQFREGIDRPDSSDLERLAITGGEGESAERHGMWDRLLSRYSGSIDEVVVWREDPALDAITERRYDLMARRGEVRVYVRRDPPSP
jgi:hypothetical protein